MCTQIMALILIKGDTSASQISELSHSEEAWTKYCNTTQMISYNEAFGLKAFDFIE
ncbi:MAG: hypothetical protein KA789_11245 [Parabacteroides sp.]|nr:hypothetical protein [Parabacteroides sp.]